MTIAHITFEYLGKEKLEIEEYIKIMTALKGINFVRLFQRIHYLWVMVHYCTKMKFNKN